MGFFQILAGLAVGAVTALKIALGAAVLAFIVGLLLALTQVFWGGRWTRLLIAAYVEWMRNVPALAHLFLLYFGLAAVGIRMSPLAAAITGLGLVGAAVLCEVFSAAFRTLHAGQREAALAVGLTPWRTLRFVLIPQMMRLSLPSIANFSSQLIKDTSIASAIAAPEVMFFARNLVTSTFDLTVIYAAALLLYAAMVWPVAWVFSGIEKRLETSR